MLYKLGSTDGKFDKLSPVPFKDFSSFNHKEKDLENLIANNILDVLYEDSSFLPIFTERSRQPEADIYALNENGDLIIFELKRQSASEDAVLQALRYAQDAGQWTFAKLSEKFRQFKGNEDLLSAHQAAFSLEHKLNADDFNNKQCLIIIGGASDSSLIKAIDYWRSQGVDIRFLPYRIYEIGGDRFFEFFALPYDIHRNPGEVKGVLFDTCSQEKDYIWYMMENQRVAAFGLARRFVNYVYPGDTIFFSHSGTGVVAAARVLPGEVKSDHDGDTLYRDVEFITKIPSRDQTIRAMPFNIVKEVVGKRFFWARTIKVPYLSYDEAKKLEEELKKYL